MPFGIERIIGFFSESVLGEMPSEMLIMFANLFLKTNMLNLTVSRQHDGTENQGKDK